MPRGCVVVRALLVLASLALAGCSAPAGEPPQDAHEFQHELADGAIGNGGFAIEEGAGPQIVELWIAPLDPTATTCAAEEAVTLRVRAPDGRVHDELRLAPGPAGECPERKRDAERLAAGDWTIEAAGRGPLVARVRVADA